MTKVRLTRSLLAYRQRMAELVDEVREEKTIACMEGGCDEVIMPRTEVIELWTPGLLRPPRIELLWPDLHLSDGQLGGLIQINTSEDFGIIDVYVSLDDDRGNHLESDFALGNELVKNHWGYFPSAPASPGTTIVVRAVASDALGGIAAKTETITV